MTAVITYFFTIPLFFGDYYSTLNYREYEQFAVVEKRPSEIEDVIYYDSIKVITITEK